MADGASSPALTINSLSARGVVVPMRRPLVTGGGSVTQAPLVLIDLQTTEGPLGHAYAFTYTPLALAGTVSLINEIGTALAGYSAMPFALSQKLTGMFKLLGHEGLVGVALAGIDTAAWDAFAKSKDMPLYQTLGADHTALPLYNSCGLGLIGPNKVGDEAKALLEGGFTAVKLRLGYHTLAEDLAVVDAVRNAVPPEIHVMTDYNQSLTIAEAKIRVQAMADRDLTWIEEPTRYADYDGHAEISAVSTIPIQLGE
ncbi:MAG: enolase C-terminal domain-like protein, partial [Pseudomonadota bacterium]